MLFKRLTPLGICLFLPLALVACSEPGSIVDDLQGIAPPAGGPVDDGQFVGCATDSDCVVALGDIGSCAVPWCDPKSKNCKPLPVADGQVCEDGTGCTVGDRCTQGSCQGVARVCTDSNACTDDSCDPASGECRFAPNSALCDDGQMCTLNDRCQGGGCSGDPNPACQCTVDGDCAQFDDADLCNGELMCDNAACVLRPGSAIECDPMDTVACQENACSPSSGKCEQKPRPQGTACDDGDACSVDDACFAGECVGKDEPCDDQNPCTDDVCDKVLGCIYTGNTGPCDDGDPCTVMDQCANATCVGTPNADCVCSKTADCLPFEDGDLCNGTLVCDAGKCTVAPGTVVDCSALDAASGGCSAVSCVPATGQCVGKDELDGTPCTPVPGVGREHQHEPARLRIASARLHLVDTSAADHPPSTVRATAVASSDSSAITSKSSTSLLERSAA